MNPKLPSFIIDVFHDCIDHPENAKSLISKNIQKNRSLNSKKRNLYLSWMMDALRWKSLALSMIKDGDLDPEIFFEKVQQLKTDAKEKIASAHWQSSQEIAAFFDFPVWMIEMWSDEFGLTETASQCLALHEPSKVWIRLHTLEKSKEEILDSLGQDQVKLRSSPIAPYAYEVLEKTQITKLHAYKKGWIEIQDEGSQFIVDQMDLGPKLNIIDGCCRSGGKTLAMGNYTLNQSTIHAFDIDARVFDSFDKRLKRSKMQHVHRSWIAAKDDAPMPDLVGKADRLLVDAPCSSIGTIKRRPWLKFVYEPKDIEGFQNTQLEILQKQSKWVKKDGIITFAVCSTLKKENQNVIDRFLTQNNIFKKISETKLLSHTHGSDGFYVANLKKS